MNGVFGNMLGQFYQNGGYPYASQGDVMAAYGNKLCDRLALNQRLAANALASMPKRLDPWPYAAEVSARKQIVQVSRVDWNVAMTNPHIDRITGLHNAPPAATSL